MDRDTFQTQLEEAARSAIEFGKTLVTEALPERYLFRVHFKPGSAPLPEWPRTDDIVVAPDADIVTLNKVGVDGAIHMLWRDERIPEWIDVSLHDVLPTATIVEVRASRCLVRAAGLSRAGFNVKGPFLPSNHIEGVRFSLRREARKRLG